VSAFFIEHRLEGSVVPGLVKVWCHEVEELFGAIEATSQVVVLARLPFEKGTEVVDGPWNNRTPPSGNGPNYGAKA